MSAYRLKPSTMAWSEGLQWLGAGVHSSNKLLQCLCLITAPCTKHCPNYYLHLDTVIRHTCWGVCVCVLTCVGAEYLENGWRYRFSSNGPPAYGKSNGQ